MNQEQAELIDTWLDLYIDYLSGDVEAAPRLQDLDVDCRSEAQRQAFAISELWGRDAAPTDKPSTVSLALGFHTIEQSVAIDGQKLKSCRQAAGMKVSALAAQLRMLGWNVSAGELVEIEAGKRPDIPGTALPLLLASLNAIALDLTSVETHRVDQLLAVDRVRALIVSASNKLECSVEDVLAALRPQLAGAHFRERGSQEDDLVEIVSTLLDGME